MTDLDYSPALNEDGTEFDIVKAAEIAKGAEILTAEEEVAAGWAAIDRRFLAWHRQNCGVITFKTLRPECDCGLQAALDAALASSPIPDAGLRAAAQVAVDALGFWEVTGMTRQPRKHRKHYEGVWELGCPGCFDELTALASSPAPAGLDVDVLASALANVSPTGTKYPDRLAAEYDRLRAATRPAEDAG